MKLFFEIIWKKYYKSLLSFAIAFLLLIASIIAWFSMSSKLEQAQQRFTAQKSMNAGARVSLDTLKGELSSYLSYRLFGFVGEAQRLDWVEKIKRIANEQKIPNVQFVLDKTQVISQLDSPQWSPEASIELSPMRMELELKHEMDFVILMDRLAAEAKGVFSIEECELMRRFDESDITVSAKLSGKCLLHWYNVPDVIKHWALDAQAAGQEGVQ